MGTAHANGEHSFCRLELQPSPHYRGLRVIGWAALFLVLALLTLWAASALYFDFPIAKLRVVAAALYLAAMLVAAIFLKPRAWGIAACGGGFLLVLAWWLSLKPSNTRLWQPDVAELGWAEIAGDRVTIHNVRNCDYRTETDYTPHWETRTVNLADLRGIDLFLTWWGSPWIAHPILSFQFGDHDHLAFSIETRKEVGESYSAIRGFFRQYELIYIPADERDVVRLRSNYRIGEDVYLFRTRARPEEARRLFLEYVARMNHLRDHPEWYNALTNNCTTNIAVDAAASRGRKRPRFDWRLLLNGKSDEMLYEDGALAGELPFPELKRRAYINPAARAANDAPDFSERIRERRPGFEETPP
ncbi:MAG TPA: DUF4105 domain-containing protein [Terriglobales bacterium]|nr:DUF4105 domain-containing protein [Terriglobales bacterium]